MPCSWASSHIVAASTPPPRCACSSARGSSSAKTQFIPAPRARAAGTLLGGGVRLGADERLELALLEHLRDDVAAADELAVDEQLRDRRPVGPAGEHLADAGVHEDVACAVLDPEVVGDLDHLVREAAPRHLGRALHVEEHLVPRDLRLDRVEDLLLGHREGVAHVASGARVLRASAWMLPSSKRPWTAA